MQTTPTPRRHPVLCRLRHRCNAAFTVIEIMVAATVMIFGITSSILVMQHGFRALDTARKTTLAAQVMQSEMERIRMLNWSQMKALVPAGTTGLDFNGIFPQTTDVERRLFALIEETFRESTRTVVTLSEFDDEICRVDVTIRWKGLDGISHTRTSSTQYCKEGLYVYYYRKGV